MFSLWITGFWLRAYWTGDRLFYFCIKCRLCTQSTQNPRFSLPSGEKNAQKRHHFNCKFQMHTAKGAISYCIILHPLCSLHETFLLTFSSFLDFLFFIFFTLTLICTAFNSSHIGNSLSVHGDFLLQCRITVDNVFTPFEMIVLEIVPSHLKACVCCSSSLVQDSPWVCQVKE